MRLVGEVLRLPALPSVQTALQLVTASGPAGLSLSPAPLPALLGPAQVLVRVRAASVNPLDVMMTRGYGDTVLAGLGGVTAWSQGLRAAPALPCVLGRDFSGVVAAVGPAVKGVKVGEEVWGVVPPGEPGSHQEFVSVERSMVGSKPKGLDHQQAAGIPYAGLTAWAALSAGGLGQGRAGAKVLVLGAGGGVGDLALQLLSRHLKAEVTAVCAGDAAARAEMCGAAAVLDYTDPQYSGRLLQLPRQDLVLDCAGLGTGPATLASLLPVVRRGGALVSLSSPLLRNTDSQGLLPGLLGSFKEICFTNVNSLGQGGATVRWAYFRPNQSALATLGRLVGRGQLVAPPMKVVPLARAQEAYMEVEQGHMRGKLVLSMAE